MRRPVVRYVCRTVAHPPALLVSCLLLFGCAAPGPDSGRDPVTPPTPVRPVPLNLSLCNTGVSNAPTHVNGKLVRDSAIACLRQVPLLVAPAPGACMTSGFGKRRGRLHKGIDYQRRPAGAVVAAGDGRVHSIEFREKDFGLWVILDHGAGVYTGYAHLKRTIAGLRKGSRVRRGAVLGTMGRSGNATRAVHLHVEYRHGDIDRAGWFGLTPVDPFKLAMDC